MADAAEIAKRTGATIISNYEVTVWFNKQGLQKTHPLNHGGGWRFDFGRVKFVTRSIPAASRTGRMEGTRGDLSLKAPREFLLLGGYRAHDGHEADWRNDPVDLRRAVYRGQLHQGHRDAIRAAEFVRCQEILGLHYNTFPPIKIDSAAAIEKFSRRTNTCTCCCRGEPQFLGIAVAGGSGKPFTWAATPEKPVGLASG